jgi:hypothetical protein
MCFVHAGSAWFLHEEWNKWEWDFMARGRGSF